jgi:flavin-dependent dehydrogenase
MSTQINKNFDSYYDVIIIGAGPAGASAASELIKSGCKVLVIEQKKLPRYKMCSGLIMDRAQDLVLEKFGTPPPDVFCRPRVLKGISCFTAWNVTSYLPLEKPEIWNVWRSSFDHWLIKRSGADLLESHRLIGLSQTENAVQATILESGKKPAKINAAYLIGCDGGRSLVRKLLAPAFEEKVSYLPCIQVYCNGVIDLDPEYYYMFFDPNLSAFYTWLHVKDNYIVYGVNWHPGKSAQRLLKESTDYLASHFSLRIEKIENKTGCVISDMPAKQNFFLGEGRVLLAGEAAGFMNLFGEGISAAIATGAIAGLAVFRAVSSGKKVLPIYADGVKNEEKLVAESWAKAGMFIKKSK